jgi:putative redox protein
MTVALYARRKGWPLEEVSVQLRYFRVHAVDCAECETKDGYLDRIEWRLEFTGTLSDDQRSRLREIANRCPVHRTLVSTIDIRQL